MRASVLRQFGTPPMIEEVPDPICPADGIIVKLAACGVCRSDHHAWRGVDPDVMLPHVMGHEFSGVITQIGPQVTGLQMGQRVTAPFILSCGTCSQCKTGEPTTCATQDVIGFTMWGAFAQYLAIPHAHANVVPLPDAISFDVAAAMGCRVTTAWRAVSDRAQLRAGEWVTIVGVGGAGLSALMIAKALGAHVIAVDPSPQARALALSQGADHALDPTQDILPTLYDITGGGAHVAIEAVGLTSSYELGLRSLRKMGRYVQIGMPTGAHETVPLPLLELVYARQLTIMGMRGLSAQGFAPLLNLMAQGVLDFAPLITQRIALSEVAGALAAMDGAQPAGITVVTDFAS